MSNSQEKKRVIILGANGYIGCSLYFQCKDNQYNVLGVDNGLKERNLREIGASSLKWCRGPAELDKLDISTEYKYLKEIIQGFRPDVIVNLAQQPSAPFSFIDANHATETQRNNIMGGLNVLWAVKEVNPDIHIIQLGTAGEYPDWLYPQHIEIPESSRIKVKYQNVDWEIPTPRYFGSWYHASKMYSSFNADYACRIWGLRVTDINQGIVYGHTEDAGFWYDYYFGTVYNRFIVQAVLGIPLTVYGTGDQMRSFININNSIQAIDLLINNPPEKGEYRIIQQLTELYTINQIADMVSRLTGAKIEYYDNPRAEMKENKFKFEAKKLKTLGLQTIPMQHELTKTIKMVQENKENIVPSSMELKTKWN